MFLPAECVRVVVDRVAAETHCTAVGDGATAAEALARRAQDLDRPPPRYKGNFLCGIDGYPETGCGDEPPSPYWSVWYFRDGKWVYSSLGVADLRVEDRDGDGHPDPLGFRFHEVDDRSAPRANPGYPRPSSPAATRPSPTGSAGGGPRSTAAATTRAAAPGASSAPASRATPGAGSPTPSGVATSDGASGEPAVTEPPDATVNEIPGAARRGQGGGFPVGTAAGAVVAMGLLGAAALRFRRPA